MSISEDTRPRSGVSAADCVRLWATLTTDYIPSLGLAITPQFSDGERPVLVMEVIDESAHSIDGKNLVNVWARKEFSNPLHLISVGQLYDLLIVAYRAVDAFFEQGEAAAPLRRER